MEGMRGVVQEERKEQQKLGVREGASVLLLIKH